MGIYNVDTANTHSSLVVPQLPFSFDLSKMEAKTSISRFFDETFLQSLKRDEKRLPNYDGMSLWIFYSDGKDKDSVNLGNDYPQRVDSIIQEQLNYISEKTNDTAMKAYIKQIKEYL
ncbi:MAG: hypothetical protein EOO10_25130 [Chitinophagaceae bacterium]|nr:MAG: hypothetical protein EOO10_25130 [Chitinophagaceae bacterium]